MKASIALLLIVLATSSWAGDKSKFDNKPTNAAMDEARLRSANSEANPKSSKGSATLEWGRSRQQKLQNGSAQEPMQNATRRKSGLDNIQNISGAPLTVRHGK
jgi:hypothetical protein